MTSGLKGSNPPREFICERCGNPFVKKVYPSYLKKYGEPRFCSIGCRNKNNAQAKVLASIACPICGTSFKPYYPHRGRKKYCCERCANIARGAITWTPEMKDIVASRYPIEGPDSLAQEFGVSIGIIRNLAYRLGITMTDEALKRRVWNPTSERMKEGNPMFDPKVRAKVAKYWQKHPDKHRQIVLRAISTRDKTKPSGLEKQLHTILDGLNIKYEIGAIIKPKFVVDVKIGNLIIQADGDYWHGHSRFEPLTERQKAQQRRDKAQDKYLMACGYAVMRIWESDMSAILVKSILAELSIL